MSRLFLVSLLALVLAGTPDTFPQIAARPQSSTGQSDQTPTFKVNVKLVLVRVVVRDAQGNVVGNLQKEDFQLFDKGKPQVISQFAVEMSRPLEGPGKSAETSVQRPHSIAYVFDDEHLKFANLNPVREAAKRYLPSLTTADQVAVLTSSGKTMLEFTNDRAKIENALSQIKPAGMLSTESNPCPNITYYQADMIVNKNDPQALSAAVQNYKSCLGGNFAQGRSSKMAEQSVRGAAQRILFENEVPARQSIELLANVVKAMSHVPGQRTVVFVSPGFWASELQTRYSDIVDRALRSQIVVNTIDARGVYVPGLIDASQSTPASQYQTESDMDESNLLSGLAEETGGIFVRGTNDFDGAFRRASGTVEYSYVLGFAPQDLKSDGKYHTLKVTLKNQGKLTVQARRGYFAPDKQANPEQEATAELKDELFSREELHQLPVYLQLDPGETADGKPQLTVMAHIDLASLPFRKDNGQNHNVLTCDYGIFDQSDKYVQGTQKVATLNLKDETLAAQAESGMDIPATFDVKPGQYTVRLVVRDEVGQQTTAETGTVTIP